MYGRRGLSSNVGNRSLPTTTSSSACVRLCACGKRTRTRKREVIEDTVSIIKVSKRTERRNIEKHAQCLSRLKSLVNHMCLIRDYNTLPWYSDPIATLTTSSCSWRSEPTRLSNSWRFSHASECTAVPLYCGIQREGKAYNNDTREHPSRSRWAHSSPSHSAS